MELCQRIFWCLAFLIFWQSLKSIGSIEQSSEPQKIPDLCFLKIWLKLTICQLLFMFLSC